MLKQLNYKISAKPYIKYMDDVLKGDIVACDNIILACERADSWFKREDIYFDYDCVDRIIYFISKLKHSTGRFNNKPFILLPWQSFLIANIFGWKWNNTKIRVISNVYLQIARKNSKSSTAAALALAHLIADNEAEAEIDIIANSRQQAQILFEMVLNYSQKLDPKSKFLKRYRDSVRFPKTKGKINVLSSDSMTLDGWNASMFIEDEFHAAKDWSLYNVMKSSQGMREQPLAVVLTTAGFLLDGYPCYQMRKTCIDILKGLKKDDTQFALIYELDEDDDFHDENTWIKANPSIDDIVSRKYLRDAVVSVENNPALEVNVKTKNFNLFCQSEEIWISEKVLKDNMDNFNVDKMSDYLDCYLGIDLSSVSDLSCYAKLFDIDEKLYIKLDYYLPNEALKSGVNCELYKLWKNQGYLHVTPGNCIDYDYIFSDIQKDGKKYNIMKIGYDPYNSTQFVIKLTEEGFDCDPFSQSIGHFNLYTKEFERLLKKRDIVIEYNPITIWCFENATLKTDHNENSKPVKIGDESRKIDGVIAIIEALGEYIKNNSNYYMNDVFLSFKTN